MVVRRPARQLEQLLELPRAEAARAERLVRAARADRSLDVHRRRAYSHGSRRATSRGGGRATRCEPRARPPAASADRRSGSTGEGAGAALLSLGRRSDADAGLGRVRTPPSLVPRLERLRAVASGVEWRAGRKTFGRGTEPAASAGAGRRARLVEGADAGGHPRPRPRALGLGRRLGGSFGGAGRDGDREGLAGGGYQDLAGHPDRGLVAGGGVAVVAVACLLGGEVVGGAGAAAAEARPGRRRRR